MAINTLGANYSIYSQPVSTYTTNTETANPDESIMSDKLKLETNAAKIGAIGGVALAATTIYAFSKGKKTGNTGFKAITEGYKAIGKNIGECLKKAKGAFQTFINGFKSKKAPDGLVTDMANPTIKDKLKAGWESVKAIFGRKIK